MPETLTQRIDDFGTGQGSMTSAPANETQAAIQQKVAQMSAKAEAQMRERVLAEAGAKPGEVIKGAQVGALQTGTGTTPVTFQAYKREGAPKEEVTRPTPKLPPTPAQTTKYYDEAAGVWKEGTRPTTTGAAAPTTGLDLARENLFKQQEDLIQRQFNAQQEAIQREGEAKKQQVAAEQATERGMGSLAMARMGAFSAASGVAYGQTMVQRQRQELNAIDYQIQTALMDAQFEADENRMELAFSRLEEIDKLEEKARQARKDHIAEIEAYNRIEKYERENAFDTISALTDAGYGAGDLPKDYLEQIDTAAGLPSGFSENLFTANQDQKEIEALQAEVEAQREDIEFGLKTEKSVAEIDKLNADILLKTQQQAIDIINAQKKIPIGQSIQIGDQEYIGLDTSVLAKGMQIDEAGNGTYYMVNTVTGEAETIDMGHIGSSKDGFSTVKLEDGSTWRVNRFTNEMIPMDPADAQIGWGLDYPDGSQGGQCGEFIHRFLNDYPYGMNTLEQKKSIINVGKGEIPQVGDAIITSESAATGHVAMINDVYWGPDNKPYARLTESNFNLDERVHHTRVIALNNPKVQGYFRGTLVPGMEVGTDSSQEITSESFGLGGPGLTIERGGEAFSEMPGTAEEPAPEKEPTEKLSWRSLLEE
jgi:hypothetical protein